MKDINILDNSKAFFDSLSVEDFDKLLNQFGFEYEDISTCTKEIKIIKKYIQNTKINSFINKKMYSCINEIKLEEKCKKVNIDYFGRANDGSSNILSKVGILIGSKNDEKEYNYDDAYDNKSVELGAA